MSSQLFLKFLSVLLGILIFSKAANAQLTSDLSLSTGAYEDQSYSEISYGLNWYVSESWVWRNAGWARFSSSAVFGIDTSFRWVFDTTPGKNQLGFAAFAGPGLRISDSKNTGLIAEGGMVLKAAGLALGGGLKFIYYSSPGQNSAGTTKSKSDSNVFMIISVGAGF